MSMQLKIQFLSEWHTSTGAGAGPGADLLVCRNAAGLPYLPARTLRGLLLDAAELTLLARKNSAPLVRALFGGSPNDPSGAPAGGLLDVRNATLPPELAAWFQSDPQHLARLFTLRKSTAIDPDTGAAQAHSLRSIETVVPMTLEGRVSLLAPLPTTITEDWGKFLHLACQLVRSAGLKRHRGLGRCVVTLHPLPPSSS